MSGFPFRPLWLAAAWAALLAMAWRGPPGNSGFYNIIVKNNNKGAFL